MIELLAAIIVAACFAFAVIAIAFYHHEKYRPDTPEEREDWEYWRSVSKRKI